MRSLPTITSSAFGHVTVETASLSEEISAPTRLTLGIRSEDPLDPAALAGARAVVTVEVDDSVKRKFPVAILRAHAENLDVAAPQCLLEVEHPVALLRLRKNSRTFVEKSVKEIVEKVLEAASVTCDWKASRGTAAREICVQYGETDYDFFARLLEEEGIFWLCSDEGEEAKLLVADATSAFTPIAGDEQVPLTGEGEGMGVHAIAVEHVVTTGAVTLVDYDCEKPAVDLTSKATFGGTPAGELFEYPGRYTTQGDGASLAKIRAEELASDLVLASGTSGRMHFRAGSTFELTSPHAAPAGKYLLRSVEHELALGTYVNRFVASPAEMPFRPRRVTQRPVVHGTLAAIVTGPSGQEINTDRLGRMTARYPFDREAKTDETSSQWIRVMQPTLAGSMMLARMDWEMAIRHLDGDPDRPIAVARMYDGENVPPETLPGAKTKTAFGTLSSPRKEKRTAFTIEDKGGSMLFDVVAAKDLDATILHDETEKVGASDSLTVGKDSTALVGGAQTVTVEKDDAAKAAKDAGVSVGGDRKKTVTKDETVSVGGALSTRIDGDDEEAVGQNLEVSSDKEMLERAKGDYSVSVGGSLSAKSKKDYTIFCAGKSTELVGGAKSVDSSDGPLNDSVGGDLTITIGGAWIENVDGNRVSSAKGDMERTVAALGSLTATGKVQIKAKTIKITVTGAATFLGAGGVLSLTPASVALVGTVTLKGSGGVEIVGAPQMAG